MNWPVLMCLVLLFENGLSVTPHQNVSKTVVEGLVTDAIEVVSHSIAVAGFDPYHLSQTGLTAYPVPNLLSFSTSVKNVIFNGASHIAINNVTFDHSKLTLYLDLSIPLLYFSVAEMYADVGIVGKHFNASIGGSLLFSEIRIRFAVKLKVNKTGMSMSNITVDFVVGDVASDVSANFFGRNLSTEINKIFNNDILLFLKTQQIAINEALASLIGGLLKEILGT